MAAQGWIRGQETVLFHQSVRENLLWAQPGATEEELREALLLASAGFVYDLPGGLESVVATEGFCCRAVSGRDLAGEGAAAEAGAADSG